MTDSTTNTNATATATGAPLRNRMQFYRRRNTPTYTFMAWSAFVLACGFEFGGIYTLKEALSVQGYYAVSAILLIVTSFLLQKVARDNDEDNFLQTFNAGYRRRNTSAFTFLSWAGFVLAILAEYIGVFNLEEPLSVKGYYAIGGAFLIVSCLVLQKTIRDNEEDKLHSGVDAVEESFEVRN
ncbi:Uncharacterized membrane protein YiaA [Paenibacillus sp. OV219]|nr:Uncharacterized membrane protein YiaA [Paenibacillus sp. OV219]